LSINDLSSFGTFKGPDKSNKDGARSCGFDQQVAQASDPALTVSVDVRDNQNVDSVNDVGQGLVPGKVNGRKAVQAPGPGSCTLALAVGDTSRVDIGTTADDTKTACDAASKIADIVEPKLPKG
jgi:hypothetical protein